MRKYEVLLRSFLLASMVVRATPFATKPTTPEARANRIGMSPGLTKDWIGVGPSAVPFDELVGKLLFSVEIFQDMVWSLR